MLALDVVLGDITAHAADAVVNPADQRVRGGGGVDGAVHQVGGPAVLADCIARFPHGLPVGEAGWTTAGELPARFVIHAVGPDQRVGQSDPALLAACFRRTLEVADSLGIRTLATPLVGTGASGGDPCVVAEVLLTVASTTPTRVRELQVVVREQSVRQAVESVLCRATPLRLLQGVRELHRRGHHRVRALPYLAPSGAYWRVEIAEHRAGASRDGQGDPDATARTIYYSTAGLGEFTDIRVTATTTPEEVAGAVLRALPGLAAHADDPEYAAWFESLVHLAELTDSVPIAFSDCRSLGDRWWFSQSEVTHPAPPVPGQ